MERRESQAHEIGNSVNHVIRLTLAGVLASVLVGCASPSGPDANVLVPGPGEGLIVGSMGYELPDEPGGNPIGMGMATGVMTLDLERVGASGSAPCHIAITPL